MSVFSYFGFTLPPLSEGAQEAPDLFFLLGAAGDRLQHGSLAQPLAPPPAVSTLFLSEQTKVLRCFFLVEVQTEGAEREALKRKKSNTKLNQNEKAEGGTEEEERKKQSPTPRSSSAYCITRKAKSEMTPNSMRSEQTVRCTDSR
jgi:hypothetical protein